MYFCYAFLIVAYTIKNNRYAFEGIISAFKIAEIRGHEDALLDLGYTIDEGLYKLGGYVIRLFTFLQCSVAAGRCIFIASFINTSFFQLVHYSYRLDFFSNSF